jgi:exonuclease III
MKIQPYSTRVRAPTNFSTHLTTPAASAVTDTYDGTTLNPPLRPGRVGPDDTASTDATDIPPTSRAASPSLLPLDNAAQRAVENSPRFVSRGKPFQISTMNTRTLNPTSRMHELVHAASLNKNDIICIQEHRQHHQSLLSYQYIDGYQLITASATKNSINATVGGVGFLVSPKAQKSLLSVEKVNSRIILLHLNGSPNITVICVYAPTNTSEAADKTSFYASLSRTAASIPPHNLLAVCGDFNAKLGPDNALHTMHTATNENGELLHDFSEQHRLVVTNTRFQKPQQKLWTYEDPKRSKHQIDFVLWRKKWINSVKNCQAYNTMSAVGSDHRIVTCFVKISYRVNKKVASDPLSKVNWKILAHNHDLRYEYAVEVNNRYDALLHENSKEHDYPLLMDAVTTTALRMLPKKVKKKQNNPYNDPNIKSHREKLQLASLKHRMGPSFETKDNLEAAKKDLDSVYTAATKRFVDETAARLDSTHEEYRHSTSWQIVRELSGNNSAPYNKIPGENSTERLKVWYDHFKSLLGEELPGPDLSTPFFNNRVSDELSIDCSPFTLEELTSVIKSIRPSKAPGLDNIPPSVWKEPLLHKELLHFCNDALMHGNVPSEWSTAAIVPFPKKGDLTKPANYRGISLTPVAAKIYNKLLMNRIYPFIDPLLRHNQNGFRRGRSTLPQILSIRRLLEECQIGNRTAAMVFVDFSKAFDSINREAMFHILHLYGIPLHIIQAIKLMYLNSNSRVRTADGLTEAFLTLIGVLQGDTLAPLLFIIVLDYILRQSMKEDNGLTVAPRRSSRFPAVKVTDLDFADDLALISDTIEKAQRLLHDLETAASDIGLHVNDLKTEFMLVNIDDPEPAITTLDGKALKQVQDFKYLGSYIADSRKDFNTRKGMAWTACIKLQKIWNSKIPAALKRKFFKACVEPVLLYGSETWTIKKAFQDRLDGTYTRLLMKAQNLSWKKHPTKKEIYSGLPPISSVIAQRRARFAGHCMRAQDQLISTILPLRFQQAGRGRRPLTFPDIVARDVNMTVEDMRVAMLDRAVWRCHVHGVSMDAID